MSKLIKVLSSTTACLLMLYATVGSSYCALFIANQPKVPACLIKE